MNKSFFSNCPRCGYSSLENLKSFSHCANCLYFEDRYEDSESQARKASRIEKEIESALNVADQEVA